MMRSFAKPAAVLAALAWPEVVGTIAGDDTIFVATLHSAAQTTITRRLCALMEGRS